MSSLSSEEIPQTSSISLPSSDTVNLEFDEHNLSQITITWKGLNVYIPEKTSIFDKCKRAKYHINNEPKRIISNVDGLAKPYEVLAIMGASGAGKTTLLNCLNFRNRGKLKISGEIRINGCQIKSIDDIRSVSSYVQQDDLFMGYLTVKEHLLFQAMLRMDKETTKKERMIRIRQIINDLNLKKCENSIINMFGKRGISGGEKRRLAFASEIITNPSILFCDEPTSGLDSFMASSVMESMKKLARQGKTIICTIHQPSSEIYESFDKLSLIAEGRLAYLGDLKGAAEFFASQKMPLPLNYNPADYYIRKLAVVPHDREKCLRVVNSICDAFSNSEFKSQINSSIKYINQEKYSFEMKKKLENDIIIRRKNNSNKTNFFSQLGWLLWRSSIGIVRDPFSFKIQVFQTIIVSLLFGLIYLRLNYDQKGIMDMNGYLFLCICNHAFATLFLVVNTFPLELPIFLREYQNGMYKVISYYISKICADLPTYFVLPILFMTIAYWMANLNNNVDRFFICTATIVLVVQCSLAFGGFLSAVAPSTNVALALAGPVLVPLMIFSGFLLNNESVPKYFIWLRYLSWFSYSNEIVLINQWKGVSNITCPESANEFCFKTGEQIIDYYKIDQKNYGLNFGLLGVLIIFWRSVTYVVLLIKVNLK